MDAVNFNINPPLSFNQLIEVIRQLPNKEKLKLREILKRETEQKLVNDKVITHFATESVLAKDWLLTEEDEAWKDL